MCNYVSYIVNITLSIGLEKTRSRVLVGGIWPAQFRGALLYLMWGKTSRLSSVSPPLDHLMWDILILLCS